jgi:hypothetical protein
MIYARLKSLTFDEDKATLTVVGDVDVVKIVDALCKARALCKAKHLGVVDLVIDEKEAEEKNKGRKKRRRKRRKIRRKKWKKEAGAMRPDDVPTTVP